MNPKKEGMKMKKTRILAGILTASLAVTALAVPAMADQMSVTVQTEAVTARGGQGRMPGNGMQNGPQAQNPGNGRKNGPQAQNPGNGNTPCPC